jgi:prepilin-type N-terminal cleavage/methylation domain-containing protein
MKKEKGFTLIELLAVIIILGILMLVAIPSVTNYINNSRKSAYIDTALNYVKGAINLVNEGKKVGFYDEDTLLLIPVGHGPESMVKLESGGQSPYNSKWFYAYVGVVYDNKNGSYSYFYTSSDESGQGIGIKGSDGVSITTLVSEKDMESQGEELIIAGLRASANTAGGTLNSRYVATDSAKGYRDAPVKAYDAAVPEELKSFLTKASEDGTQRLNIVICTHESCDAPRVDTTNTNTGNQTNGG